MIAITPDALSLKEPVPPLNRCERLGVCIGMRRSACVTNTTACHRTNSTISMKMLLARFEVSDVQRRIEALKICSAGNARECPADDQRHAVAQANSSI